MIEGKMNSERFSEILAEELQRAGHPDAAAWLRSEPSMIWAQGSIRAMSRVRAEALEEAAAVADGFDAAVNSEQNVPFFKANVLHYVYRRDAKIAAAIRSLSAPVAVPDAPARVYDKSDDMLQADPPAEAETPKPTDPLDAAVTFRDLITAWQDGAEDFGSLLDRIARAKGGGNG